MIIQIIKASLIFLAPFLIVTFLVILGEGSIDYIGLFISISPAVMATTYFSVRRFYLIIKLSKIGVEVTAYYRELINAALGLGLIKVQFTLNGKEEECCLYDCRSGYKQYRLLIDPNNFKHYLILGVEN